MVLLVVQAVVASSYQAVAVVVVVGAFGVVALDQD